jgi:hypothetical protein
MAVERNTSLGLLTKIGCQARYCWLVVRSAGSRAFIQILQKGAPVPRLVDRSGIHYAGSVDLKATKVLDSRT